VDRTGSNKAFFDARRVHHIIANSSYRACGNAQRRCNQAHRRDQRAGISPQDAARIAVAGIEQSPIGGELDSCSVAMAQDRGDALAINR